MMRLPENARTVLDRVADLLEYPGIGFEDKIVTAYDLSRPGATLLGAEPADSDLVRAARAMATYLESRGRSAAEEHFTILFDLSPVCTLNVGHHLFGDAYQRGELLAGLVGEMRRCDISIGDEIPDHLPLLLRLLGRLEDPEDRTILASAVLLPGLERITAAPKDNEAPWSILLQALPNVVQTLVPDAEPLTDQLPMTQEPRNPIGYEERLPRA